MKDKQDVTISESCENTTAIVRVITHTPLLQYFDYKISALSKWKIGSRVRVPFGKRKILGVIVEQVQQSDVNLEQLKEVSEIIDAESLLPPSLLKLSQWASQYYHYPPGEILFGTLPKLLRRGEAVVIEDQVATEQKEKIINPPDYDLNAEQQHAVDALCAAQEFKVFLLQGVTGSGKTEVYFCLLEQVLQQGKQALILVPEIALTPQTVQRFQDRFDVPIAVLHSRLSDRKRVKSWVQARTAEACILIGTRSAIFTPMKNLGAIILDEEHDASFKQQTRFRYSARDLAIVRGQFENIPVVLGSATPSLESMYNASRGRYQLLKLNQRVGVSALPLISTIDLRQQKLEGGLSVVMLQAIKKHLEQKQQVFLFLNRRGYAPVLMCHHCGWMVKCKRCDAHMTMHQKPQRLFCHHCGDSKPPIPVCLECRQSTLTPVGSGTERLEQVLTELFPDKKILRVDSDSVRNKKELEKMLQKIHDQEGDILIGTQMLAKGHHFPHLNFVGIVDGDSGFFSIDFRATERMGQLILQVAGRAGRVKEQGVVMIQTHHPDHPLLKLLLEQDYEKFAEQLLNERQSTLLPPFAHLALLRAEDKNQNKPTQGLLALKARINAVRKNQHAVDVLGPIPAAMELKAGRYRAQLLFRAKNRASLHHVLSHSLKEIDQIPEFRKLRWSLDIDPQEVG